MRDFKKFRYLAQCVSVYYPDKVVYMRDFLKFLTLVLLPGVQVSWTTGDWWLFHTISGCSNGIIRVVTNIAISNGDAVKSTKNNSVDSVNPSTDRSCFANMGRFFLASV